MSKRMQATARFVAVGILAALLTGCITLNIDFSVSSDIRISLTVPGAVTDSNGEVDGNTVTWRPKIGQRLEIHATASAIGSGSSTSSILLIGLIALGVIAVIVVVALVMKGRRAPGPG